MKSGGKKTTIFSVYFTFFVDNLSWAIVFPIFAPYFLDPGNTLFSQEVSFGTRSMILGFFLTAFSLGQFIGAPLMGEYADRYGRKKALLFGIFFTLVGLLISALSMKNQHLIVLFFSRLLTGLFASTTTVCLSCISDLSETQKQRVKRFAKLSMLAGLSFIIGAFLGGKLSSPSINPHFSYHTPFWIAGLLTFANLLFVLWGFQETFAIDAKVRFRLFEAFRNILIALKTPKIKRIYFIYMLFLVSWTILFQYTPVLMVQRFSYTSSRIGDLSIFMGLCWAIGSGYISKLLLRRFSTGVVLETSLLGFTALSIALLIPKAVFWVLIVLGVCVTLGSIAWPLCTDLISSAAPRQIQGKIMGLSQSVQSFAMTIGPLIGGFFFHISLFVPFLVGGLICLAAFFLYYFILKTSPR